MTRTESGQLPKADGSISSFSGNWEGNPSGEGVCGVGWSSCEKSESLPKALGKMDWKGANGGKAALQPNGAGGWEVLSAPTCTIRLSFWTTTHLPGTGEKPKADTLQKR